MPMSKLRIACAVSAIATVIVPGSADPFTCPEGTVTAVLNFEEGMQWKDKPKDFCFGKGIYSPDSRFGGDVCIDLHTNGPNAGAEVFDAACGGPKDQEQMLKPHGRCRRDTDLFHPEQGNVLVLQQIGSPRPNDAREGGCFEFTLRTNSFKQHFSKIFVESVKMIDITPIHPAAVKALKFDLTPAGGTEVIKTVHAKPGESGNLQKVDVNADDVDVVEICLEGSGAIDYMVMCMEEPMQPAARLLHSADRDAIKQEAATAPSSDVVLV